MTSGSTLNAFVAGGGGGGTNGTEGPGGGGGSSFVAAGATNVTPGVSALPGDGQVTITYDPATDACAAVTARFTG